MSIGRRVVRGVCRWSTACVLVLIRAAPVLIIFAFLLPANAQWGNSQGGTWRGGIRWGSRRQEPYNPYGGFGHDRQGASWGYRQREGAPSPRLGERVREVEKGGRADYSHPPPATPRED